MYRGLSLPGDVGPIVGGTQAHPVSQNAIFFGTSPPPAGEWRFGVDGAIERPISATGPYIRLWSESGPWLGSADGRPATLRVNCGESPLWGGDGDNVASPGWNG